MEIKVNQHRALSILYKDICNNCGKYGHSGYNCKMPITSFGVVVFRNNPISGREYLMICRKDTLGYIDFIRGKYQLVGCCVINKSISQLPPCLQYVMNMIKQMTMNEKIKLQTKTFRELWYELWNGDGNVIVPQSHQYKIEENNSLIKFNNLKNSGTLDELIRICNRDYQIYEEPEWGFPKGRKEFHEKEYDAALRETIEESGFPVMYFINIKNILPFSEIFLGSNYKIYKHQYYLMYMKYENSVNIDNYERSEVSDMKWFSFDECMNKIRKYNLEKKTMLKQINTTIDLYNQKV